MNVRRFLAFLPLIGLLALSSCANRGSGNTTSVAGTVNHYSAVISMEGCSDIELRDASNFNPGDLVLVIQMQGAVIDPSNSSSYGTVSTYRSAGLYEYARIDWVSRNHVGLKYALVNTYDPAGKVQLVYVPEYKNIKISAPLTCQPWNGHEGGVLALRAHGSVLLGADINVDGKGFRGGKVHEQSMLVPQYEDAFVGLDLEKYAYKGEGVAGYGQGNGILGRGAPASGGGGGGNHNAGGGGGANGGCGGLGGYAYKHGRYSGDYQSPQGIGGHENAVRGMRLFLGGGGGAGHSNNQTSSDGGNGGGIVLIQASKLISEGYRISSRGESTETAAYDGASGAGAGGTIALLVREIVGDLVTDASGGKGGNTRDNVEHSNVGTGGGGGGGVVRSSIFQSASGALLPNVQGGANGITINNIPYGATPGCDGAVYNQMEVPQGTEPCDEILLETDKKEGSPSMTSIDRKSGNVSAPTAH